MIGEFDELCDSVARLELRPADAALIYRALSDYRANNLHTFIALMRIPGLAVLWTRLECTCAATAARDNPGFCDKGASAESLTTQRGPVGGKQ